MKKQFYHLCMILCLLTGVAKAQVGIGTKKPDPVSALDIVATDKGILIPRLALRDVQDPSPITSTPTKGLLVFNTNTGVTGGNGAGFYYWSGQDGTPANRWVFLGTDRKAIIDTLLKDKTFRDSVIVSVKGSAEKVEKRGFIELYNRSDKVVSTADSSVLNQFKIGVNSRIFRDSVSIVMQDSLSGSQRIKDTLLSVINKVPGRLGGNIVIITDQDYTVKDADDVIIIKGMTTAHTVTLPPATANRILIINQFTPGQTLNFSVPVRYSDTLQSAELLSTFGGGETGGAQRVILISDGNAWYVTGCNF